MSCIATTGWVVTAALLLCGLVESAGEPDLGPLPEARMSLLSGPPPAIDGRLDEACWAAAARLSPFVVSSRASSQPAANRTEAFLLRDREVLYVGARCYDADMKGLSMTDWFDVFIADRRLLSYYHFWIHPSGATDQDGSPGIFDLGAPQWHGRVSLHADRWEVEIAIPFFNLSAENLTEDLWRLNICRQKYAAPKENSQWSNTGGYFHVPERFGFLRGMAGVDFTPSVDVAARVKVADAARPPVPDHMLLDRSYYTSEKEAVARVFLSEETRRGAARPAFEVSVSAADGKTVLRRESREARGPYLAVPIPLGGMANGRYAVRGTVRGAGRDLSFSQELVKLPPHPHEVKVNRFSRLFLKDGRPFIPLLCEVMMWGRKLADADAPDNSLEIMIRDSGFNVLIFWITYNDAAIEECGRLGMPVIVFDQNSMTKAYKAGGQEAVTEKLVEIFTKYRDLPHLFGWFIADEGNLFADEKHFAERFRRLKEVDPYHPIFRNESGWSVGHGGPGGPDSTDIYCGGYGGYRLVDGINVDAVPRGVPSMSLSGWFGPPELVRYPTPSETVCWFYQLLVHGACGAFWWGAHGGKPPVPGLWEAVRGLRAEADTLAPVLDAPEPPATVRSENPSVHCLYREHGGARYLVCVNVSEKEQRTVFPIAGRAFGAPREAKVLFEDRSEKVGPGGLPAVFGPMERRVYSW